MIVGEAVGASVTRPVANGSTLVPKAVERLALARGPREARGQPPAIADHVIDAQVQSLVVIDGLSRSDEVIHLCVDIGRRLVWLRPVFYQIAGDRADPRFGDLVTNWKRSIRAASDRYARC